MASSTTACARPTAPRSGCGRARWSGFCRSSPPWGSTLALGAAARCSASGPDWFIENKPRIEELSATSPDGRPARSDLARRGVPLAADSGSHARRERISVAIRIEIALALSPGTSAGPRFRRRSYARLDYEPGESHSASSAATPTGGGRSGFRSTSSRSSRCDIFTTSSATI